MPRSFSFRLAGNEGHRTRRRSVLRQVHPVHRAHAPGHDRGARHLAVVPVPDPRLEVVAALAHSREVIPAQVRFLDVPGGTKSARGVAELRETNALCVVVRAFGPDQRPAEELAEVTSESLLADLA